MNNKKANSQGMIDFDLKFALEKLQQVPLRNLHNAARGRARFLFEAQEIQQEASRSSKIRQIRRRVSDLWSKQEPIRINPLAAILVVIVIILIGTTTAVAAAQSALPDQPLYGLKLASENIHAQLTLNAETRFELTLQFANRRIGELEKLHQVGIKPPETVLTRYQFHIKTAAWIVANMQDKDITPALLLLQRTLMQHNQIMLSIQFQNPDPAQYQQILMMIQTELDLAAGGLQNPVAFRHHVLNGLEKDSFDYREMTLVPLMGTKTATYGQMLSPQPAPAKVSETTEIHVQTESKPPVTVTATPTSAIPTQTMHPPFPQDQIPDL